MRPEPSESFVVLDTDPIRRVELAIEDLRQGRMVILVDDEDRENEGDLVVAAELVTPDHINFMATHARGLICLSLTSDQVQRLGLSMMAANNQSPYNTAFTVSIEAREGVTTGISAADRAHTVRVAISPSATPRDIVTPGHMFPLRARDGGVLERVGQTEGSVDLTRMAGLTPAGVICEVMRPDGTMARMPDLLEFGSEHGIRVVAVADIIKFRMRTERIVNVVSSGAIEVPGLGTWQSRLYRGIDQQLHLAVYQGQPGAARSADGPTLVRVQEAPPAWSFLHDGASKLARQARLAMQAIAADGAGAVILMHLGGTSGARVEQTFVRDFHGADDHGVAQARAEAVRDLGAGCQILLDLGVRELRLLAASNRAIVGVEAYGLKIVERVVLLDRT